MKRAIILLMFLSLSSFTISAQYFSKSYSNSSTEYGQCAIPVSSGGFMLLKQNGSSGSFDLIRTDNSGNVLWDVNQNIIGANGSVNTIIQTADGGYAVAGSSSNGTYDPGSYSALVVFKFDSSGTLQWGKGLVGTSYGESGHSHNDILQTPTGQYIVAGSIQYHPECGNGNYIASIIKLSSSGSVVWNHAINCTNSFSNNVIQLNGFYYVTGSINGTYGYNNPSSGFLAKYDDNGNQIFLKTYSYGSFTTGNTQGNHSLKYMPTNQIAIVGNAPLGGGTYLLETDTLGNEITHYSSGTSIGYSDLVIAPDSNVIITGSTTANAGDLLVSKIKYSSGSIIWSQTYGGSGNDGGTTIRSLQGGNLLICGTENSFGFGGYDAWLLVVNSIGTQTNLCTGVTATISPQSVTTFCQGDSVILKASAGSSYAWSNSQTTQSITVNQTGKYLVTVTNANNCTASDSVRVLVNATPIIAPSANPAVICNGDSTSLSANATAGSGSISNYAWSSGLTGNVPGGSVIQINSTTYSVTVTNSNNCTSSDSVNVNSFISPAPFNLGNDTTYCGNFSRTLATGNANTLWSTSVTSPQITISTPGRYWANITNGCGTASDTIIISVQNHRSANILGHDTSFCSSDTILLNATTPGSTYQWQDSSTAPTFIVTRSGIYSVSVSASGCTLTDSINVSALPPPTITGIPAVICSGDSSQICAPTGLISYHWNTGENNSCIYAKLAGNYYVTVTDNDGCTVESQHFGLIVHPVPSVSITVQGDTLSSFGADSYQWYFNGTTLIGDTFPQYIATVHGNYSVGVTDTNGCQAISNPIEVTGIINLQERSVEIYPNPAYDHLIINNLNLYAISGYSIKITNCFGQVVFNQPVTQQQFIIDIATWSKGVYVFNLIDPQQTVTNVKEIVIE